MLFYLEYRRVPRDAYRVFSKYLDVTLPNVVIDTDEVERYSVEKRGDPDSIKGYYTRSDHTIHLRQDFEARTAIHEFFHHLSNDKKAAYNHDDVYEYAKEVIDRGRLLLPDSG